MFPTAHDKGRRVGLAIFVALTSTLVADRALCEANCEPHRSDGCYDSSGPLPGRLPLPAVNMPQPKTDVPAVPNLFGPPATADKPLNLPGDFVLNPVPSHDNEPNDVAMGPENVEALQEDHGWPAGSVQAQLDRDATLVPYGKGAIFVPAMTQGLDEPPVTIWRGDAKVADALSGKRIVLSAGDYYVQVGSGSTELRFGRQVQVRELKTTIVPANWCGLTVHVVDAQLNSLRNAYEIIRMRDRVFLGVGFGSDEQAGESLATWIMQPGLYKIVRIGGTYRDRTDFSTVRLMPGQHTHFLLVQDPVTGAFEGAGEARSEELFRPSSTLRPSLILGGDATFNSRQSVASYANGSGYTLRGFMDIKANALIYNSPFLLRLQLLEGQTKSAQFPWQKDQDFAQVDLLYVYNLRSWAGPYVRAQGVTNLFASYLYLQPAQSISIRDLRTGEQATLFDLDVLRVSPPFGSTVFGEGVGFNWRLFKAIYGEMTLRTGLGARQEIKREVLQPQPDNKTSFLRLKSGHLLGFDTSVIATGRLTRFLVLNTVIQALIPFDRHTKVDLQISGTASLKLTQYAAVNYVLTYHQGPLVGTTSVEQDILLRFSLELL